MIRDNCVVRVAAVTAVLTLATVAPSLPAPATPTKTVTTSADDARQRLDRFMDLAAAEGFTGTVLVARQGKILLEKGYGLAVPGGSATVTPQHVFTIGSITKQFTAAAVLKLQEAGKLSITDPISKYLGEVPADKQAITIHHLLSHQAGFPGAIGDDRERVGRDEFVHRAMSTPLEFAPGTAYAYSNVGFSLAAAIVEQVSGKGYEEFLHAQLFKPAGMTDTGYNLPHWRADRLAHGFDDQGGDWGTVVEKAIAKGGPGWHLLGNGGIHSTGADMHRWHEALKGERILNAASKKLMYTHHAEEGGGTWYGYGWSLEDSPWGSLITHNGGNRVFFADFLRFPDSDVDIYLATTSRDRRMQRLGFKLAGIVLGGENPEFEPAAEPMRAESASEGPAPAPGSAAERWGFPGSFRGQRAAEFLDAVKEGDDAARRAFIQAGMEPGLVERNGLEKLVGLLGRLRQDLGNMGIQGLQRQGDTAVVILVDTGKEPEPLRVILGLEAAEPHRITRIELAMGD